MTFRLRSLFVVACFVVCLFPPASRAADDPGTIRNVVDAAVQPLMQKDGIPGMAVGIVAGGKSYVFDYGLAARNPARPVTHATLFEVGSVSKTFTATLASYAQVTGHLSLQDTTSRYLPSLKGTPFGNVSLLNLGTHTPGGLPLQVPDNIQTDDQLMQYFKKWRPSCKPGTCRTYSNVSIGTLGLITAKSMNGSFESLIEQIILRPLGMTSTYLQVPDGRAPDYAQGYTKNDRPIRMAPGELSAEAYGIRTTAGDMVRFLDANMGLIHLSSSLERAIADTHTGYFEDGGMTQDLIWEQYPYPVALGTLLEGNSPDMALKATPVRALTPAEKPRNDARLNKTGSTNGFGAYIAFIPSRRLGIVMLANKNFPNQDRVAAAYSILQRLAGSAQ